MKTSNVVLGIVAIVGGLIVLLNWISLSLIVGIVLIVIGILVLVRR